MVSRSDKQTCVLATLSQLAYVFDRFTQTEVPSRHIPGGVGIRLAIAHHIVELYNGTIYAESVGEGQGTIFTVKRPMLKITLSQNS